MFLSTFPTNRLRLFINISIIFNNWFCFGNAKKNRIKHFQNFESLLIFFTKNYFINKFLPQTYLWLSISQQNNLLFYLFIEKNFNFKSYPWN